MSLNSLKNLPMTPVGWVRVLHYHDSMAQSPKMMKAIVARIAIGTLHIQRRYIPKTRHDTRVRTHTSRLQKIHKTTHNSQ